MIQILILRFVKVLSDVGAPEIIYASGNVVYSASGM
jgi:hypothetical protein